MAKVVQHRRGTTTQHSTFTGAVGELTVDTTKDTLVVHDGATAGGHPLLKESAFQVGVGAYLSFGTGSPEGVKAAPVGSIYLRTDGGASTVLYVKESGAGNTGWVAK